MIEDKELDAELEKKALMKQSQESVMSFEKKNIEDTSNSETKELVDKGIQAAVIHKLQNEEAVQSRFLKTADKIIDTNVSRATNDAEKDEKRAIFENNKDACDLYGIDEKTVPKWVVKCAMKVQDFWYAMWLVIGFFTTAPVVFLSKKIRVILKKTWIAVIFALLIYLAVISSPIWLRYLNIGQWHSMNRI